ncbi:serine/threonine-protein kinase [Actinomadura parmotrematis]|uniref:Serine/threonine protein kinase n=1 Tax=Actinomadura parmotrematis TaxID=2864039 RepID=A0ABS7G186_9ACTN|nr:serine/threonine-protein kinase [Actinomadura parmotrematis]MBW8485408.1 serine/threonine protein kinase [Actinomadura parmotrematis]
MTDPHPLGPGDPRSLGGYALLGRLGDGGQGVVFLARPAAGGPPAAVKLLHARLLGDPQARARFVRELALLQRVAGFCTARVLAADMAGDQPYIVSEYVPGPSLRELVRAAGPRRGADLDRLAISTLTALTAIHRAGIVHRDFKPQNVLVGPDGPRVIDFGIARALDTGATLTGHVVGTPVYMAPEQFRGGEIGPAADLFAWAATMLFAATGRDAFAAPSMPAVFHRVLHHEPDLGPLPLPVAEIAGRCLAKDPADRPTAEQALLRILGGTGGGGGGGPAVAVPEAGPGPATESYVMTGVPYVATEIGGTRPEPQPAPPPPAPRRGRRGPSLVAGLVLAGLLAVLDVATTALIIVYPPEGDRSRALVEASAAFTAVAVVTLAAVVLGWRGSRAAVWTAAASRVARVALWGAWSSAVGVTTAVMAGYAALTAAVVVLLARGVAVAARRPR